MNKYFLLSISLKQDFGYTKAWIKQFLLWVIPKHTNITVWFSFSYKIRSFSLIFLLHFHDLYTVHRTKAAVFHPLCIRARQYPDDLLQHFHKRCFSSAVGGLWVWFTKHAHWPCELAPVTLLPLCLFPPWPDHTAPVTTVLLLPTGYNYSAFCCYPFSLSLMFSLPLSLSARLGLDTEVQAEGRGAAALCSQRAERHSLCRGSEQVGGGNAKGGKGKGRRGVLLTGCQGLWAAREVGVVG